MKILPITNTSYQYNKTIVNKNLNLKGYRSIVSKAPEFALFSAGMAFGMIMKMAYNPTLAISSGYGDEFHNSNTWEPGEYEEIQAIKLEAQERAYIQSHPGIGSGDEYFTSDPDANIDEY